MEYPENADRAVTQVTLAQCGGQIWLVNGEEHLDLLLVNQLPAHVTVELVQCESRAEIYALWQQRAPDGSEYSQPWALNPAITKRILGGLGLSANLVQFTPWSAMLDTTGRDATSAAVAWLAANPAGTLLLRQWAAAAPGHADLQRLRLQLVTAALTEAGVDGTRLRTEIAPAGTAEEQERVQIVTEPG